MPYTAPQSIQRTVHTQVIDIQTHTLSPVVRLKAADPAVDRVLDFEITFLDRSLISGLAVGDSVDVFIGIPAPPPTIDVQDPPAGGTDVGVNVDPSISFDFAVDPDTVAAGVVLVDGSDVPVPGTGSLDVTGKIYTFVPDDPFANATEYHWVVSETLKGANGIPISAAVSTTAFTTAAA